MFSLRVQNESTSYHGGHEIVSSNNVQNHARSFVATDYSRRRLSDAKVRVIQPSVERNNDILEVMDLTYEEFGDVVL